MTHSIQPGIEASDIWIKKPAWSMLSVKGAVRTIGTPRTSDIESPCLLLVCSVIRLEDPAIILPTGPSRQGDALTHGGGFPILFNGNSDGRRGGRTDFGAALRAGARARRHVGDVARGAARRDRWRRARPTGSAVSRARSIRSRAPHRGERDVRDPRRSD